VTVAEPLKDSFGADVVLRVADMIAPVADAFPREAFIADALDGYEALELTPRARRIAAALARALPPDPEVAIGVLVDSLGPTLEERPSTGMSQFVYLPHVFFVRDHGLACVEASLRAQHAITQRFSCEFSIRTFIERAPAQTMPRLGEWTRDPSEHVRRLVSEGTRPRLPWAPRLRGFMEDPTPVIELLDALKDDRSEYVRRSVANNLNDISKDHPDLAVATARRWMHDAGPDRRRLVAHGLRTLIKAGDSGALGALGFEAGARADVTGLAVVPAEARIGDAVDVTAQVTNPGGGMARLVVDLRVHFVKARGTSSPKVFKVRTLELAGGERVAVRKRISLRQHSTRTHHPGLHRVEVMVNGAVAATTAFTLDEPR